jgi:hypothetical protein
VATQTTVPVTATTPLAGRIAAGTSVLFAVSFFLTVASVDVPHQASGAELLAWWQDSGHQTAGIVSLFSAMCAAVCLIVTVNYFRALVAATGGQFRQLTQFAHSMTMAFSITLMVSAALRGTIGHLVKVDKEPLPGLDVLRLVTSMNSTLLGTVAMTTLSLSMLALSVVVIKTAVLAKWVGFLGIGCAVVILAGSAIMRGQYAIPLSLLWALGLAVALLRQPRSA